LRSCCSEVAMEDSRAERALIHLALLLLVFVGVSASISPWLDRLYGEIAVWVVGAGVVALTIWALVQIRDAGTAREVARSWRQNGHLARQLAERHAAHPEVAKQLAARMAEERERAQQLRVVPPPAGVDDG
jgi:hypothetical protein